VLSVRNGNTIKAAAEANRIDRVTAHRWVERGDAGADGDDVYIEFATSMRAARAAAEERWIKVIDDAVVTDWKAASWLVEREARARESSARIDKLRAETEAIRRGTTNDGAAGEMLVVELPADGVERS